MSIVCQFMFIIYYRTYISRLDWYMRSYTWSYITSTHNIEKTTVFQMSSIADADQKY